jgi:diguanylate cyclase (GGDEF)-like protein
MDSLIAALRFPLYDLFNRLPGPRRVAHKILLVALLGALTPLFLLALYVLFFTSPGSFALAPMLVVLAGSLLGAAITLFAVQALLTPISAIGKALGAFEKAGDLPNFGRGYRGEIGELLNDTELSLISLRHSVEHLEACAQLDTLTRLPNRQGAGERLKHMALEDEQNPRSLLLLLIDLEGFSRVNETHGSAVGDSVLRQVGNLLRASLRERDWVARWGDDEFLLVLSNNDRQDVSRLAGRLQDQLRALPVGEDGKLVLDLGFNAGAAYFEAGMTVDELIEKVDEARCHAKQNPDIHCFVASEVSA